MNEPLTTTKPQDDPRIKVVGGSGETSNAAPPFPKAGAVPPADQAATVDEPIGSTRGEDADKGMQGWVERAAGAAHRAIDALAGKASSAADGAPKAGGVKDEWLDAAREAIRERPVAAIGVALLIGAGVVALTSSRER